MVKNHLLGSTFRAVVISAPLALSGCGDGGVGEALAEYHRGSSYAELNRYVLSIGGRCSDVPSGSFRVGGVAGQSKSDIKSTEHSCDTPSRPVLFGSTSRRILVKEANGEILDIIVLGMTIGF
jgi:hypothetical protein